MGANNPLLKAASKIEIISLMDNCIDYLSSTDKKEVVPLWKWTKRSNQQLPLAEHGFSVLVRSYIDEEVFSVLFDAGISADGVVLNAQRMGVDLSEVDFVVLSHGHYDHFGGLELALKAIGNSALPLIAHGNVLKPRGTADSSGNIRENPPFPTLYQLGSTKIIHIRQPYFIGNDSVCVTGEIPRTSKFELGYSQNRVQIDGEWIPDPDIIDDQALILNLLGKGLVVISGCAHAGIINTIRFAQQITGVTKVYAVLGGFHLAGKENERRIEETMKDLKSISPILIVPFHCTGWRANQALSRDFPDAIAHNSVGNLYQLK